MLKKSNTFLLKIYVFFFFPPFSLCSQKSHLVLRLLKVSLLMFLILLVHVEPCPSIMLPSYDTHKKTLQRLIRQMNFSSYALRMMAFNSRDAY